MMAIINQPVSYSPPLFQGVGEEYQDHHLLLYPYRTKGLNDEETLDGILSGRKDFVKALGDKDPQLGWNGIDICAKLRPSDKEIEASDSA
jgi:alcohol oxidase